MNREYFANRLKYLRFINCETQKDIADAVGVNNDLICRYEKQKSVPTVDVLCSIAKHYGVTVDSLLFEGE